MTRGRRSSPATPPESRCASTACPPRFRETPCRCNGPARLDQGLQGRAIPMNPVFWHHLKVGSQHRRHVPASHFAPIAQSQHGGASVYFLLQLASFLEQDASFLLQEASFCCKRPPFLSNRIPFAARGVRCCLFGHLGRGFLLPQVPAPHFLSAGAAANAVEATMEAANAAMVLRFMFSPLRVFESAPTSAHTS